jgi:hypothetical protein
MSTAGYQLRVPFACALALAVFAFGASPAAAKHALPVLNVVPKTASGGASATIGSAGGRLHVTAPKGMSVTLTIPAGAIGQDTRVTMTPLAAVKHIPFRRGLAGGVKLAPEGLTLMRPAKLSLRPGKALPRKLQTAFAASGIGKSFHIYPGKRGRALELPLLHFSIYGEGAASATEVSRESGRKQANAESEAERDLAQARSDKAVADALEPWMKRVAVEVKAAGSDDRHFLDALDDALSLAEALRLQGWSSSVFPDIGDQIPKSVAPRLEPLAKKIRSYFPTKILDNAMARAADRCVANLDPSEAFRILIIEQLQRLFGSTDEITFTQLEKCLRFDLDLRMHLTDDHEGTYKQQATLDVSATHAPLRFDPSTFTVSGDVPLTVDQWDWYDNICFQHGGAATPTAPGQATIALETNTRIVHDPNGSARIVSDPPKLTLKLDPGQIDTESQCQVNAGGGNGAATGWYQQELHAVYGDLQPNFGGPLTFTNFVAAPGDPFAVLDDARPVKACSGTDYTCAGDIQLTLHHTPSR